MYSSIFLVHVPRARVSETRRIYGNGSEWKFVDAERTHECKFITRRVTDNDRTQ